MMKPEVKGSELSPVQRAQQMYEAELANLQGKGAAAQKPQIGTRTATQQTAGNRAIRNTLIAVTVCSLVAITVAAAYASSYTNPETGAQNYGNQTQGLFDQLQDQTSNALGLFGNATSAFFGSLGGHVANLRDQSSEGFDIFRNATSAFFSSAADQASTYFSPFGNFTRTDSVVYPFTGFDAHNLTANLTAGNATANQTF